MPSGRRKPESQRRRSRNRDVFGLRTCAYVTGNSIEMRRDLIRRWFVFAALVLIAPILVGISSPGDARAQDEEEDVRPASYWDATAGVEIPGELGQTQLQVYIPQTQHTVRGYMLDTWRAQGASSVYGNPVSEPFGAKTGYYSQAFEGAIFQFRPEYLWTETPSMTLEPIGRELLQSRTGQVRRDGKRQGGGGDRRASAFRSYGAGSGVANRAAAEGGQFNATTGQSISGSFLDWYAGHDGDWFLGAPLSQPVAERGAVVQYFEGAVLIRSKDGSVRVAPVVRERSRTLGVRTAPVAQNGLPEYSETLLWLTENPNPLGDPYASGRKWIEISISQQTLWAYQGGTVISSSLVSTGLDPNTTQTGLFHVRYKLETQDMAGTVNEDGEVVALGQDAAEAAENGESDEEAYTVEDVPHVMYFNLEAEALHGAYWHNNFGTKMSHGCVNLPLNFATWLYGWAPLGTEVWVHE
jgi:hypothetical protein